MDRLAQLSVEDIAFILCTFGFILLTQWGLRFIFVFIGRMAGCYTPDHYTFWLRLPWRIVYKAWLGINRWYEKLFIMGKRGHTGGFASWLETLSCLYQSGMLHLGSATMLGFNLLQPVGLNLKKHLMVIASTGSGKTTALITMLATWKNSVFVIDPKGQVTKILAKLDRREWFVIDPDNLTKIESASFNPFDCLHDAVERYGEDYAPKFAERIAYSIVIIPADAKQPYFYTVSRAFLSSLILHVYTQHPKEEWNLITVRKLIIFGYILVNEEGEIETKGNEAHDLLMYTMSQNHHYGNAITGGVTAIHKASQETGGNVWSTLSDATRYLDLPAIEKIVKTTSLTLRDLKTRKDVVLSFVASASAIREELAPLARLLNNLIYYTFEDMQDEKGSDCLLMIDELPSQGKNERFADVLSMGRGYGLLLVGIAQNIGQLKNVYNKGWEEFFGESSAVLWMATSHSETSEYLTKLLGKKTIIEKDPVSRRKTYRHVDVMDAEQIRRFMKPENNNLVVTRNGNRPLLLKNDPYFKALAVWQYAPDPEHGDRLLRKIMRFLLRK